MDGILNHILISRKDAAAQGLKVYFTGKPCKHGHIDTRLVVNGTCRQCSLLNVLEWQRKNPKKAAANMRRWQERNPGVAAERRKQWYQDNLERHKTTVQAYLAARPGLRAALSSRARAAQLKRTPKWLTPDDFWMMDEIYALAQQRTNLTGVEWHVDHIIPLRGRKVSGLHTPHNLRVVPALLNLQKGNRYAAD